MKAVLLRHPNIAALIAGFLSATGFAPLGLWPVTIACFATLLLLVETAPDRRAAAARGWLFGLGHFTLGLNWIAHAFTFQDAMPHGFGYGAVVLLSLYLAVFPGLATLGAWWLARMSLSLWEREGAQRVSDGKGEGDVHANLSPSPSRRPTDGSFPLPAGEGFISFILLFAACWIVTEYLRATLFTGFAWNPIGVVWLPTGVAIASTVIGTYGLGALVPLAAGATILATRRRTVPAAAIILPIIAIGIWGLFDRAPATPPGAPRIRVVQPNIGQDEKYSPALERSHFQTLAALSGKPRPAPRLIFWPEAAIPAYLDMEPDWRDRLAALMGPGDLLMTGATKVYYKQVEKDGYTQNVMSGARNSLWIVTPDARLPARYDKAHLVPYGEYLPMRPILSAIGLSRLVPGDVDFLPGPGPQSLDLPVTTGRPPMKMGVQICYEIIFSGHVVDEANRPAFLFNPSNDAWFGSWGPVQHLAQARLRALEEGLPIIRSTPTGISAVIDARGQVDHALGANRAGYLDTGLPPPLPRTLFARLGNGAAGLMIVFLVAIAIATRAGAR